MGNETPKSLENIESMGQGMYKEFRQGGRLEDVFEGATESGIKAMVLEFIKEIGDNRQEFSNDARESLVSLIGELVSKAGLSKSG